jgi:2-phospho-L-lactate guanylyltransferase
VADIECCAIVAVNARALCKTRLADVLDADDRRRLACDMLARVLEAVRATREVSRVVVVSPERDDLPADVPVVIDPGTGLNDALDVARRHVLAAGACPLLVLPGDLPQVTPADLERLVAAGRRAGVAIATNQAGIGTNGLYLSRPQAFRFRFGPASRAEHESEAARHGFRAAIVRTTGLLADLDTPADVAAWAVACSAARADEPAGAAGIARSARASGAA